MAPVVSLSPGRGLGHEASDQVVLFGSGLRSPRDDLARLELLSVGDTQHAVDLGRVGTGAGNGAIGIDLVDQRVDDVADTPLQLRALILA
jgi:hypothetical protein